MLNKLIEKYKNIPTAVKASFWFLVCGFIQRGISLITTPIFTRLLSTSEYGEFTTYNSWYNIVIILASLNLASGVYMRGLVKYEQDQERFTASMNALYLLTTAVWFLIYLLFQKRWNVLFGMESSFVYAMFVDILAATAYQFWATQQRVDYRYRNLVIVTVLNAVLRPAMGIFMIRQFPEYRVEARIFSMVAVDAVVFLPFFLAIFKNGFHVFTTQYWKYALAFNLPLVPHYLSQIVLGQADRLMIKKMIGKSEAGIYGLAYTVASVLTILNTSLINTLTPWLYKKMQQKKCEEIGKTSLSLIVLVAVANFALVALAPELVAIMSTKAYYEAIWIIPPVTVSTYFIFLYSLFSRFEFYYEKTQFMMIASVLGACANLILNYIFIPKYGYYAAGYTTLACYILYAFGHYVLMRRLNRQFMDGVKIFDTKRILFITLIFTVLCAAAMSLYEHFIGRMLLLAVICAFFAWKRKEFMALFKMMKKEKKK